MRLGPFAHFVDLPGARRGSLRDEGAYLTDGRRLFRVVAPLGSLDRPDMAILEDCKTLELVTFTAEELGSMPLTSVIGAPAG